MEISILGSMFIWVCQDSTKVIIASTVLVTILIMVIGLVVIVLCIKRFKNEKIGSLIELSKLQPILEKVKRDRKLINHPEDDLKPGDAIGIVRKGYKHHAIVVEVVHSTRCIVIHLTGNSADSIASIAGGGKADVCKTPLEFGNGNHIYKYTYHYQKTPEKSLEIAEKLLKFGIPREYHLTKFNCEHFICYCKTGYPYSKQSKKYYEKDKKLLDEYIQKPDTQIRNEQNKCKGTDNKAYKDYSNYDNAVYVV